MGWFESLENFNIPSEKWVEKVYLEEKKQILVSFWEISRSWDVPALDSVEMLMNIKSYIDLEEEFSFMSLGIDKEEFNNVLLENTKKLLVEVEDDKSHYKATILDIALKEFDLYEEVGISFADMKALVIYCREKYVLRINERNQEPGIVERLTD